jgi:hypothetical protein
MTEVTLPNSLAVLAANEEQTPVRNRIYCHSNPTDPRFQRLAAFAAVKFGGQHDDEWPIVTIG